MRHAFAIHMLATTLACAAALLPCAIGSFASAGPLQSPPNNPDSTRVDSLQAGWGFYANSSGTAQVNELGIWVSPADSSTTGVLASDHEVALFNYQPAAGGDYKEIAHATVLAGSSADATGYAWAQIPVTTLTDTRQTADYYIVMARVGTDVWAPLTGSAHTTVVDGSIGAPTGNGWFHADGLFPGVGNQEGFSPSIGNNGYFGPNVGFVPEPSSLILAALGAAGLFVVARRRRVRAAVIAALLVGSISFGQQAQAGFTVISDDFSSFGTTPYTINGNQPSNVNLPGGNYTFSGNSTASMIGTNSVTGVGNLQPAATSGGAGGYQGDLAITLASSGTYTKPTLFAVSADLQPGNISGPSSGERGIGVGFYASVSNTYQYTNNQYTGFALDTSGNLSLIHDTTTTGFPGTSVATVAFGGTFNANDFYTLTYTVNTVTGNLSNISLSGSSADYSSLNNAGGAFTNSATTYLALYASSASANPGQFTGYIDNISVTAVPEPTSLVLLSVGALGLLLVARRRRKA